MNPHTLFRSTNFRRIDFAILASAVGFTATLHAVPQPSIWSCAPTPPKGWNIYEAWGTSIIEGELLVNACYMQEHLLSHGTEIWVKQLKSGDKVISLFNRSTTTQSVGLDWKDSGLIGTFDGKYAAQVPSHGAVVLLVR